MAVINNGLRGVSDQTKKRLDQLQQGYNPNASVQQAQQNLQAAQANKPGAYQPNQAVQQAQQQLQQVQSSKPQGYNSKYQAQLDNILSQIQNPGQFKYEFNGDNLFKAYADQYVQKGKQAALDVQGQAAGMTGGYGNSYGQSVGQQQYQQYLLDLYDKGMDLRDRAYQGYLNDLANQKDIYNILQSADAADYDRYRDTVGDWQNERNYATDLYNTERNVDYNMYRDTVGDWENERDYLTNQLNNERNFDYNVYSDMLNNMMNQAQLENKDYWTAEDFAENQRQYNESLAENIRQADLNESFRRDQFGWNQSTDARDYAYRIIQQMIANGQMPTAEMLMAAGLSEEDARRMIAQAQSGGGGGTGGNNKGGSTATAAVGVNGNVTGYYVNDGKGNTKFVSADDEKAVANLKENVNGGKVTMNDSVVGLGATNVPAITPNFANAANTGVSAGQVKADSTNKQTQKAKTQVANDKKNVTTDVKNKKNQTTK